MIKVTAILISVRTFQLNLQLQIMENIVAKFKLSIQIRDLHESYIGNPLTNSLRKMSKLNIGNCEKKSEIFWISFSL